MTTRSRVDLDPLPRSQIIFEKYMQVSIMDTALSGPTLSGHLLKSRESFPLARLTCSKGSSGADPGFFLGGGALVSCSTSTPINHIVFWVFFAEYQLY